MHPFCSVVKYRFLTIEIAIKVKFKVTTSSYIADTRTVNSQGFSSPFFFKCCPIRTPLKTMNLTLTTLKQKKDVKFLASDKFSLVCSCRPSAAWLRMYKTV